VRRSQNPKILPLDFVLIFRLSGEQPNAQNQALAGEQSYQQSPEWLWPNRLSIKNQD
jgi:hypothetical protein